jgi:Tol biopolymer transport system component
MKPYRKLFILTIFILAACSARVENTPTSSPVPPSPIPTGITSETPAFSPASTTMPAPVGEAIYYGLRERLGERYADLGVFRYDLKTESLQQVAPEGWNLQDVSPDGSTILINRGYQLFISNADGSGAQRISDQFYDSGSRGAAWDQKGNGIIFIFSGDSGSFLVRVNPDGSGLESLGTAADSPIEIEAVDSQGVVYWQKGSCSGEGICTREGVYRKNQGDQSSQLLEGISRVRVTSDGTTLAYAYENEQGKSSLGVAPADLSTKTGIILPGDLLGDFSWSTDGTRIAAVRYDRSDYSGKVSGTRNFLLTPGQAGNRELIESEGILGRVLFSPEGNRLLLASSLQDLGKNQVIFKIIDLGSGKVLPAQLDPPESPNFILPTNIYWIGKP